MKTSTKKAVKKATKKQIYVLALKETKDMPALYIKLEDTQKFIKGMNK